jgi:hypothetical protein
LLLALLRLYEAHPEACITEAPDLWIIVSPQVYFAGKNPAHPPGGKLSQYLDKLSIGDEVTFKGPVSLEGTQATMLVKF